MTAVKTEVIQSLEVLYECTNILLTLEGTDLLVLEEKEQRTRVLPGT